jgi:DNA-binding Lrp family transcriptional regulator
VTVLDELSRRIINDWQGGVPLSERPYADMAAALGCEEERLLTALQHLLEARWITRFGPFYDAAAMGGGLTLAAIPVPPPRFDAVTEIVNAHPEVAHNYRRDHRLNMWFVVATERPEQVAAVLRRIGEQTGLPVYDCPKQREFYIGLKLHIAGDGSVDTRPLEGGARPAARSPAPDAADRRLIAATQAGLPLRSDPWSALAGPTGLDADEIPGRLSAMLASGIIRRIGIAPNHYRLGLRGNGMTVWNVPDEEVETIGRLIGASDFVSHCYQRPRHLPDWPYNLFAMLHGQDRAAVMQKLALLESRLPRDYPHEVLFSSAILKKTGLRLAA